MSAATVCVRRGAGRACLGMLAVAAALAGCSIFEPPAATHTAKKLPLLRAAPGSIKLDAVYVERPLGDALLGPDLWRYVDQVGAVEAEARSRLRRNGLRVGIAGANPPVALQKMLGLKSDFAYEPEAEEAKQLVGQSSYLMSGGETEIQVSPLYPECTVQIERAGESRTASFEDAICKFRIRAERLKDGWARLEFIPQVDHGTAHNRRVVGEAGWMYKTGQENETFFLERFSVKLCTGNMVVITCVDDSADTLGQLFFRGPAALRPPRNPDDPTDPPAESMPEYPVQRLLIVRLAGMDTGIPE